MCCTLFSYLGFSHKGEFLPKYVFNESVIALNSSILAILVCFNCVCEYLTKILWCSAKRAIWLNGLYGLSGLNGLNGPARHD